MEYVALVTVLLVMQLMFFMGRVGMARGKYEIEAPAISGHEVFERTFRVHQNTIEQLLLILPSMWVCAHYTSTTVAAGAGLAFLIGRFVYAAQYVADPKSRGPGMGIGFIAIVVCVVGALWGLVTTLV